MIDGKNFFDQPVKNNSRTYDKLRKIVTGQEDTGCLLDYSFFNKYHKMTPKDLSKQQALDVHPKAIWQINFTGNLNRGEDVNDNTTIFFIIEEAKKSILDFSQGIVKVL